MGIPKFLQVLLGGGDKNILDTVTETADKFIYTKAEKFEDQEEAKRAAEEAEYRLKSLDSENFKSTLDAYTKLEELEVEDRSSARSREIEIAKVAPEGTLWGLTVNINAILAFVVLGMTFTLHLLKALGQFKSDIDLHMYDNITIMVVAYFFGTSVGSKNKEKILENITKNGRST